MQYVKIVNRNLKKKYLCTGDFSHSGPRQTIARCGNSDPDWPKRCSCHTGPCCGSVSSISMWNCQNGRNCQFSVWDQNGQNLLCKHSEVHCLRNFKKSSKRLSGSWIVDENMQNAVLFNNSKHCLVSDHASLSSTQFSLRCSYYFSKQGWQFQ